jgi:hypothetical protein
VIKKKRAAIMRVARRLSPGAQVMTLSAVSGEGVQDLLRALMRHVVARRAQPPEAA